MTPPSSDVPDSGTTQSSGNNPPSKSASISPVRSPSDSISSSRTAHASGNTSPSKTASTSLARSLSGSISSSNTAQASSDSPTFDAPSPSGETSISGNVLASDDISTYLDNRGSKANPTLSKSPISNATLPSANTQSSTMPPSGEIISSGKAPASDNTSTPWNDRTSRTNAIPSNSSCSTTTLSSGKTPTLRPAPTANMAPFSGEVPSFRDTPAPVIYSNPGIAPYTSPHNSSWSGYLHPAINSHPPPNFRNSLMPGIYPPYKNNPYYNGYSQLQPNPSFSTPTASMQTNLLGPLDPRDWILSPSTPGTTPTYGITPGFNALTASIPTTFLGPLDSRDWITSTSTSRTVPTSSIYPGPTNNPFYNANSTSSIHPPHRNSPFDNAAHSFGTHPPHTNNSFYNTNSTPNTPLPHSNNPFINTTQPFGTQPPHTNNSFYNAAQSFGPASNSSTPSGRFNDILPQNPRGP